MNTALRSGHRSTAGWGAMLGLLCLLGSASGSWSQDSSLSPGRGRRLQEVPEVYVPPALPWEGALPNVRLESLSVWSLRGEPLGTPAWTGPETVVLATRQPESGQDWMLAYRLGDREAIWARRAPEPVALPPVGGDGRVYAAFSSGAVQAIDAADGGTLWEIAASNRPPGALALVEGRLLVAQGSTLRALDAADGRDLFSVETGSPPVLPARSCGGRWFVSLSSGEVLALSPQDGDLEWRRRLEGSPTSPACDGKLLVVGTSSNRLVVLKARSGRRLWTQRLAGALTTAPLLFEGGAYAGALDGRVYGFKSAGGHRLWAVPVGERVRRDPVLIDGLLGVASAGETRLSFLHLPTGRLVLEAEAPAETAGWVGSPAVQAGRLALAADRRDSPDGALVVYQVVPAGDDLPPEAGGARAAEIRD